MAKEVGKLTINIADCSTEDLTNVHLPKISNYIHAYENIFELFSKDDLFKIDPKLLFELEKAKEEFYGEG